MHSGCISVHFRLGATSVSQDGLQICASSESFVPKCSDGGKPANPFLPYDGALWVTHLSDTHTCLLNKFNVVPHHVLVVTRKFARQTDPLDAADFDATLQLLQVMA